MPLHSEQSTLVATVLPATPLQILTSHLGFKENEVGVVFEEQSVTLKSRVSRAVMQTRDAGIPRPV